MPLTELARALSKLGFASRSQAVALIEAGRVKVGGVVRRDPTLRVDVATARIEVDGAAVKAAARVYLMLHKPRGLVTTASDEKGRATVYECLRGLDVPRVGPVGRLDQASEGLLLFTNDTAWANGITAPERHVAKTYHVQIDRVADDALVARIVLGVDDDGERLAAREARVLRGGEKTSWLELVLDEGKNRHIRRMLGALDVEVKRLIRVAIGPLALGALAKGEVRALTAAEISALGSAPRRRRPP